MSVRLFVGGLAFSTSTEGLREAFARFGTVASAAVMTDRETGRSRGFGFVEMGSDEEAERAMGALNGSSLDGRMIRVDKATPRGAPRAAGAGPRPAPRPWTPRPPAGGDSRGGGFGGDARGGGPGADRGRGGRPDLGGGGRRGQGQRRGAPGPGGDAPPGGRRGPGPKRGPGRKLDRDGGSGRGWRGSDGEYRWGR